MTAAEAIFDRLGSRAKQGSASPPLPPGKIIRDEPRQGHRDRRPLSAVALLDPHSAERRRGGQRGWGRKSVDNRVTRPSELKSGHKPISPPPSARSLRCSCPLAMLE